MNITDILTAFGQQSKLTYDELALRLALPAGRGPAKVFAHKLRKFNLRPRATRIESKIIKAYHRYHFEKVVETKQPYKELEITL